MYASLWRVLPGPVWLRILILLVLFIALLAVLATWVYPWVDTIVDPQDATVAG